MGPSAPAAAAPAKDGPDGITVGRTMMLMDGKIRVFVSAVNGDEGTARVAVNGQTVSTLRPRRSVELEIDEKPCKVTLDGIDRGHVTLSAACEE